VKLRQRLEELKRRRRSMGPGDLHILLDQAGFNGAPAKAITGCIRILCDGFL
jgi:hypothetical protein